MKKILVVEDVPEMRKIICHSLCESYQTFEVSDLTGASAFLSHTIPDLILLDILLPDGNGNEFCNELKNAPRTSKIPIIFLTSKDQSKDKLMAFTVGATDYIVKPFDPVELLARVKVRLREVVSAKEERAEVLYGDLLFRLEWQKVYLIKGNSEAQIELTPIEYRLLYFLARHEGHVINRDQILQAAWTDNVQVVDRAVDTHISNLRKKLATSVLTIKSVHGVGYELIKKS